MKQLHVAAALFLLPAIELGSPPAAGKAITAVHPTQARPLLATFVPGCEPIPPRVESAYLGEGSPIPRPRGASIEVFLAGNRPQRQYVVVGELEVLTRSRNFSLGNMLEYAKREARKLGGDAIVDVRPELAPSDRRGQRTLKAKVVHWV